MGTLYISGPNVPGCPTPHLFINFRVQIARDGDVWPSIWYSDLNTKTVKTCGGRFRTPMIGGGGSEKLFLALRELAYIQAREQATFESKQLSLPLVVLPKPQPYKERHMDDGHGWFGIKIMSNGDIGIAMRPKEEDTLNKPVEVNISAQTSYIYSYFQLLKVYKAIGQDNKKLGNFRGYHTY
jgi:hypothetical protein